MSRVPNRKKQRREYLKRKGKAYGNIVSRTGVLIVMSTLTLLFSLLMACIPFMHFGSDALIAVLIFATPTACMGYLTVVCWRSIKTVVKEVSHLPYIPPVTADALPAEEVLVRGSEEPPVELSGILVRSATSREETQTEQLLRISQTGKEQTP